MRRPRDQSIPTVTRTFPAAEYVDDHLVIPKRQWVPGEHPEPHLREDGQRGYVEEYYYCLRCGTEQLRKDAFPGTCDEQVAADGGDR